jgi:hydrogenase/urease accessory protein HupE
MSSLKQRSGVGGYWLLTIGLAVLLLPAPAEAHVALQSMGSFWSGVAHVLTSLDQVFFLVGLAIWTSFLDRGLDARLIGVVFITVFAGVLLGATIDPEGRFDLGGIVAALLTAVGLGGAARLRLNAFPMLGFASVGGLVGGAAGGGGAVGLSLGLFSLGGSIASASVLSYAILATRRVGNEWGRIAMRAGASWIAAIGLMLFALAMVYRGGHG